MKKFWLILLVTGFLLPGGVGATVGDVFPWPWGSESEFPWLKSAGSYRLKARAEDIYEGHFFEVLLAYGPRRKVYLVISQYDRSGRLFATGKGYSDPENAKLIKARMTTEITKREYNAILRAYKAGAATVGNNMATEAPELVIGVTFCPVRSKKCKEMPSYQLKKTQ